MRKNKIFNFLKFKLKNSFEYCKQEGLWNFIKTRILDRISSFIWRYKYKYSPRYLWLKKDKIKINKPVFVLGVEGAGLSLFSKILFHHPNVVYPEGNSDHWGGRDQMDQIPVFDLPEELKLNNPANKNHPIFGKVRTRIYATDPLVNYYRKTKDDFTEEIRDKFQYVIKRIIGTYAHDPYNARFITKPQSYTLKIPLITELLKDSKVKFILVIRNPYAVSGRYMIKRQESIYKRYNKNPTDKQKIKYGAQHWKNSYQIALNDLKKYDDFHVVRLEDVLKNTKEEMKKAFEYCELEFSESFLPQKDDNPHIGTFDRSKWYPIKTDVNKKYLNKLPDWAIEIIDNKCGDLANKFDYSHKGP